MKGVDESVDGVTTGPAVIEKERSVPVEDKWGDQLLLTFNSVTADAGYGSHLLLPSYKIAL